MTVERPSGAQSRSRRGLAGQKLAGQKNTTGHKSATVHKVQIADRGRSYLKHHLQVARISWNRLLSEPLATLMTVMVLAIALTLPSVLYVGLKNIQSVSYQWQGVTQITLFLSDQLSESEGRDLAQQLESNDQVKQLVYLSKADALNEFKQYSGFSEAIDALDDNPLPAVILLEPSGQYLEREQLNLLKVQLESVEGIEEAQVDMAWLERLLSITDLAQRLVLILSCLLGFAVLLVVGNTIRLEIENRREEIQVVKLVGGTDAFVQRPFLYTGFWYGIAAGFVAWLLVQGSLWYLSGKVNQLINLYQSSYQLQGLSFVAGTVLVTISILIGVGGAWLAVIRHLKAIEPT
ncbi:permease-like cell division protein FtsX [Motiliproteus sp. MSK22-1]|uniref:permease-like cell division protein FtsX n=1 Tax=Motiliproteus sp. MSK22-1 TaxID=1897630 RepID=UPI0009F82F92|nr:permease-like cell division protein FtsX [Motiliproteus sp. MSK22-1]